MSTRRRSACVVITRPAPDHQELQEALVARGLDVVHCPVFELCPLPSAEREARLQDLEACDVVIVTSPNAARFLLQSAENPESSSMVWIAPGVGTAAVLEQAGCTVLTPVSGGTSEDLLDLPALTGISGKKVAIVAAPGGRTLLAETLSDRGADVRMLFLYRREPLQIADEARQRICDASGSLWVLASSANVVERLFKDPSVEFIDALKTAHWVVSSDRLAGQLRRHGKRSPVVAAGAADPAMLAALDSAVSR